MTYTLEKEMYRHTKSSTELMSYNLERHIGFEPMTYTLARYRSTN